MKKKKILIATREEEAIGIATGMILAKSPTIVFMQNAGFGNSISTITSLVQMYKIPIIFIIGWRGYLTTDAPEHVKLGKIQPEIIKSLGLKSKIGLSPQSLYNTLSFSFFPIGVLESGIFGNLLRIDFNSSFFNVSNSSEESL